MAKPKRKLSPVMSNAAFEVMAKLDKATLIDLVWSIVREYGISEAFRGDDHAVLRYMDGLLIPIDRDRKQRPKLLAAKYAEARVAAAQGGAVQTKQRRVKLPAARKR